ncbi:MAG: histidine phosphatase family protein [Propionibacteriaceae bacterium]
MSDRLILWRHGLTDWNASGRMQGQLDIPLNEVGRAQAVAAARQLVSYEPAVIVASDLGRAQETAHTLATLANCDVVTDPRLREIYCGSWEGLTFDEACALDPEFREALSQGRDHRRSAIGETATETGERVAAALTEFADTYAGQGTVVVASHGLAIQMAAATLLGLGSAGAQMLSIPNNCAWAELDYRRGFWRIQSWNNAVSKFCED